MVPGGGSRVHDLPFGATSVARGIYLLGQIIGVAVASEVLRGATAICPLKTNPGKLFQSNIE